MRPHSVPITLPLLFGGAARTLLAMSAAAAAAHDAPNAPAPPPTPGGHRDVPRWSWDPIQTYMHCANLTGEWNDAALDAMAKMSYVTFESSHKMYVNPIMDQAEAKISESCRLVKERSNNRTSCLMYTETDFARRQYSLGHYLDANPELELHCKGELQEWPHYQQSRDPYTGVWWNYTAHAYDYGNPAGAEKWIERVTGTVGNGFVDGIFLDGLPYPAWAGPFGNCTAGEKANYSMGFNATVHELARRLGPEAVIIANGVAIREYTEIAAGWMDDQSYGSDFYNETCGLWGKPCVLAYHTPWTGSRQSFAEGLAAFLIALQPYQYFATGEPWSGGGNGSADHNPWAPGLGADVCDTWLLRYPEYDWKLGPPIGPATVTNDTWPKGQGTAPGTPTGDRCQKDPNADQHLGCRVYKREFQFAKVYQGQYLDPNCTKMHCTPIGNCVYWSDGNMTGMAAYCPPRELFHLA